MGSSHISLIGNLINTPLGVRVSTTFSRNPSFTSRERERTTTFIIPSIPTKSVSRSRFESLDGRHRVYETLQFHHLSSSHGFNVRTIEFKVWFSLSLSESLFILLFQLPLFISGTYLRWMLKMSYLMVIFKKKSTWYPLQVFLIILEKCASLIKFYMVSNKHLVLGLQNSLMYSLLLALIPIVMIMYSF